MRTPEGSAHEGRIIVNVLGMSDVWGSELEEGSTSTQVGSHATTVLWHVEARRKPIHHPEDVNAINLL